MLLSLLSSAGLWPLTITLTNRLATAHHVIIIIIIMKDKIYVMICPKGLHEHVT